jgi:hypothetical protein
MDHGPPEEERRREEGRVLDVMPGVRAERQVIERRNVPGPERDDERRPAEARVSEHARQSAHRGRPEPTGDDPTQRPGQPEEHRRYRRAHPEKRRSHQHEHQVLGHVGQQQRMGQILQGRTRREQHDRETGRERDDRPRTEAIRHPPRQCRDAAGVERGRDKHRRQHERLEHDHGREGDLGVTVVRAGGSPGCFSVSMKATTAFTSAGERFLP